jgi:putative GTP pyrophosphokinase
MNDISEAYSKRRETHLVDLASRLEDFFIEKVRPKYPRIDRISARAKAVERFAEKAKKTDHTGEPKYSDPLNQILDQVGVRIITFYACDVSALSQIVSDYLNAIEVKELEPDQKDQFGYFGRHFILPVPTDVIEDGTEMEVPEHFELQIKTLFQHAWAEANHDIAYKPEHGELTSDQMRLVAYAAAQAWGADRIFDEIALERIFKDVKKIS